MVLDGLSEQICEARREVHCGKLGGGRALSARASTKRSAVSLERFTQACTLLKLNTVWRDKLFCSSVGWAIGLQCIVRRCR